MNIGGDTMKRYFFIMNLCACLWVIISIILSRYWISELSQFFNKTISIIIITGIAYIPGFLSINLMASLILINFKPLSRLKNIPISILIPTLNEEKHIYQTIKSITKQDYEGPLNIIIVDNGSTDGTLYEVTKAQNDFKIEISLFIENKKGKNYALNKGLEQITSPYFITLDADTTLHKSAISNILSTIVNSNSFVSAVAGGLLVENDDSNFLTKMQRFDYALSITSIKNMQSLFASTLVAQGAFSIYHTKTIKDIGGWDNNIGEDIILTWKLLQQKKLVLFEPRAIGFTVVPEKLSDFIIQRSRWARGMIEGLKLIKPWQQGSIYTKYLTFIDLLIPLIDLCYIFVWVPGLVISFFGLYYIVGPFTLSVLPVLLSCYYLMYAIQKKVVLEPLKINIRFNLLDFFIYIFVYQTLISFSSIWGYFQEIFNTKRIWKKD
jgi:biofilm PGA synthesis N-glycosyltransferase PgaC